MRAAASTVVHRAVTTFLSSVSSSSLSSGSRTASRGIEAMLQSLRCSSSSSGSSSSSSCGRETTHALLLRRRRPRVRSLPTAASAASAASATAQCRPPPTLMLLPHPAAAWRSPPPLAAWHRLSSSSSSSSSRSSSGVTAAAASTADGSPPASASASAPAPASGKGPPKRVRLDDYCLTLHPDVSKNVMQSWIAQGKVLVNDRVVTKAGSPVPKNAAVRINAKSLKYVCRAGHKLEAALDHFGVDVAGLTALDAGLSTGGFTDCLLQRGAAHVFGVDVGHGQVAGSIAQDPRVTVMERTNLRHLKPEDLPCKVDLVTLDLAFISVLKVLPAVAGVLRPDGGARLVVLVKPQFEAGRGSVGAGGVVRDPKVHAEVIARVSAAASAFGLRPRGVIESPLKGDKGGNTEFLALFEHDAAADGPLKLEEGAAAAAALDIGGGGGGVGSVGGGGDGARMVVDIGGGGTGGDRA